MFLQTKQFDQVTKVCFKFSLVTLHKAVCISWAAGEAVAGPGLGHEVL